MSKSNGSMRPNKFRGACDRCHGQVGAGEGLLAGKVRGSWKVRHVECNHEGAVPVAQVAVTSPACGLTGVKLDPGEGRLEGRNLSRRIAAREALADEEEHARSLPAQMVAGL